MVVKPKRKCETGPPSLFLPVGRLVVLGGGSKTTEGASVFVSPIGEKQSASVFVSPFLLLLFLLLFLLVLNPMVSGGVLND